MKDDTLALLGKLTKSITHLQARAIADQFAITMLIKHLPDAQHFVTLWNHDIGVLLDQISEQEAFANAKPLFDALQPYLAQYIQLAEQVAAEQKSG